MVAGDGAVRGSEPTGILILGHYLARGVVPTGVQTVHYCILIYFIVLGAMAMLALLSWLLVCRMPQCNCIPCGSPLVLSRRVLSVVACVFESFSPRRRKEEPSTLHRTTRRPTPAGLER